jgi:hypothetical protein
MGVELGLCHNRVLRRIFGLRRNEITGGWRKFHEEFFNMYSSPNKIMMIKSRRIRWVGHVVYSYVGELRSTCRVFAGQRQ